ncbi:MAG: GT4 family glycosyltransferase PelF [Candidatus Omnitrophica bacterium]|nr:GT4 family glycosyltransferase PelF [Candidatus Omnitrophota bacterium]
MNVLQIVPELHVGGVERGTVDLARCLVQAGHKAVVVSNGGDLVRELEAAGAVHYQLPVHKKSLVNIIRMAGELAAIIRKEEIDIVHARSRAPAWSAYFACRRTKRVFITTCHGYYKKHPFSFVMGWGKRVIVLSNVIARHMIEDFGVPYERIRLIPRSVDLSRFKYTAPDKKPGKVFDVGIIGRLTPLKGHPDFIKAMARVYRQNPSIKLWIVGDAPSSKDAYKEQLRLLVRRMGLEPVTQFLGNQKDIPGVLSHLDLLVMATTTQEAFGRVIIEAQACGVPVVATAVGGVIDIIENDRTGIIVPPQDPGAMAEAIMRVMKDKDLALSIAENAYARVKERYSLQIMAEKTLAVYAEALKNFKVLVIKMSSLGDIILSTAGLRAIREKFKENHSLSFLVGEEFKEVLLRNPRIDELMVCDFKGRDAGFFGFLKLAKAVRKKNFDTVIDLQNNRRSHLLAWLSLALDRYGYDNKKFSFLLNHRVKDEGGPLGPVQHQFRVLKQLGIELVEPALEMFPQVQDQKTVDEFLQSQWMGPQKLVGINIGASRRWQTKVWPLRNLARLCDELTHRDIRIVVTGTAGDAGQAQALIQRAGNAKIINACGRFTVNQLACLIRRCGVYVSADSAPLHIAASMDTPLVALFGPTDPRRHLPPARRCVVLQKKLACVPCYKSKCPRPQCMESITAEEVLEAIEKLLT